MQCGDWGHFKCMEEAETNLVKVSFTVKNDLDEFYRSDGSDDVNTLNVASAEEK